MEKAPKTNRSGKSKTSAQAQKDNGIMETWKQFKADPQEDLRNMLVERYLPLVKYNADRIYAKLPDEVELDDLVSAGIFGLIDAIKAQGLVFEERAFTIAEAHAAREAFVTAASQIVMPVVYIDGRPVGSGKPGPVATALRRDFHRHAEWA